MTYLAPPPTPAPVVVMKDVGGYVNQYRDRTELYRATGREVRLHECRSACTLALSLPNVCVYPDSVLKFHLAYDPRNRQTNHEVSRELFESYPPAVRQRLGGLTREYKSLRGDELIALGVRNCAAPRPAQPQIMLASRAPEKASAPAGSLFGGWMRDVVSVLGALGGARQAPVAESPPAEPLPPSVAVVESPAPPLPPARPAAAASEAAAGTAPAAPSESARRRETVAVTYAYGLMRVDLPEVIDGAQPILPTRFVALAALTPSLRFR